MAGQYRSTGARAPSPVVPLFFVSVMVFMALLPWIRYYISTISAALQQMNFVVLLAPLLIILGISLTSTFQNWMYPNSTSMYQNRRRELTHSPTPGNYVAGDQHGDNTGVFLFSLLVFALILIPWR